VAKVIKNQDKKNVNYIKRLVISGKGRRQVEGEKEFAKKTGKVWGRDFVCTCHCSFLSKSF
jgi:hypothetical protein